MRRSKSKQTQSKSPSEPEMDKENTDTRQRQDKANQNDDHIVSAHVPVDTSPHHHSTAPSASTPLNTKHKKYEDMSLMEYISMPLSPIKNEPTATSKASSTSKTRQPKLKDPPKAVVPPNKTYFAMLGNLPLTDAQFSYIQPNETLPPTQTSTSDAKPYTFFERGPDRIQRNRPSQKFISRKELKIPYTPVTVYEQVPGSNVLRTAEVNTCGMSNFPFTLHDEDPFNPKYPRVRTPLPPISTLLKPQGMYSESTPKYAEFPNSQRSLPPSVPLKSPEPEMTIITRAGFSNTPIVTVPPPSDTIPQLSPMKSTSDSSNGVLKPLPRSASLPLFTNPQRDSSGCQAKSPTTNTLRSLPTELLPILSDF